MSDSPLRTSPSETHGDIRSADRPEIDAPTLPSMPLDARTVPAISVCVAVRDRPELLADCIRSVLASSFEDYEVVVVDDGSATPTRDTLAAAGLLADPRVRVLRQEAAGISAARNTALRAARGRYITVLDSDDELTKDGLARIQEFLDKTGARWIYTDYEELTGDASRVIQLPLYRSPRRMLWSVMVRPRLPFKHSGMTIDRDLLREIGGYDEQMRIKVDVELVMRGLSRDVPMLRLGHPVVRFHRHGGNISRRRLAGLAAWARLIRAYRRPRVPGLALGLTALRAASELGKWLVTALGR